MQLVGIQGFKFSGKSTVASMLVELLEERGEMQPREAAFGDMLKKAAAEITGIPLYVFYDQNLKEKVFGNTGLIPRKVMTDLHDALVPVFGEMMFVKPVQRLWESMRESGRPLVVSDVRYDREADWIRSEGGIILKVERKAQTKGTHSSEQGISFDPADYTIENNGSLDQLRVSVSKFLEHWVGPAGYDIA